MSMSLKNDWHKSQPRGGKKPYRFAPKWNRETIAWIIQQVNEMVDFVDIQVALVKQYEISLASAGNWIEIARRVNTDISNGLTLDQAIDRDQERRNLLRRKKRAAIA